jgi:dihydrofolate reductase
MRNVVLGLNMTIDGYMGGPQGELDWMFPQFSPAYIASTAVMLSGIDTFLMGRVTYEGMAPHWPDATDEIAPIMNNATKYVFSNTLTEVSWSNATLATGDPVALISDLRSKQGKSIGIAGGSKFLRPIVDAGVIDEYRLAIHPVALGDGLRLFTGPQSLTLSESEVFDGGLVVNTYRPSHR